MSIATRRLLLLTFVSALALGVVWVYQPNTPMVHADHDDPYTTHLMRNPSRMLKNVGCGRDCLGDGTLAPLLAHGGRVIAVRLRA